MRENEGKRDGQVLARLVTYIAMGVALEGLWRRQGNVVLSCWDNHGCFLDSTQEGRRAIRVATDVPRRGNWRGGGTGMCGQTCNGGSGEMMHGGGGDGVNVGKGREPVDSI